MGNGYGLHVIFSLNNLKICREYVWPVLDLSFANKGGDQSNMFTHDTNHINSRHYTYFVTFFCSIGTGHGISSCIFVLLFNYKYNGSVYHAPNI